MNDFTRYNNLGPVTEANFDRLFCARDLLPSAETAALIGISTATLRKMTRDGFLQAEEGGKRKLGYREDALRRFFAGAPAEPVSFTDSMVLADRANRRRRLLREQQKASAPKRRPPWRQLPATRFRFAVSTAIYRSLKSGKAGRSWETLVGYTLADLRAHIEAQFTDGMGWDNYGRWHIDHERPLASFQFAGPDCPEFRAAWALSNLQPLWAADNIRKGAKWNPEAA